jgi:GTPase
MTQTPKRQAPAGYQLRVAGHLDDHWSPWFGDLTLTHEDDGTTSLRGFVSDQAELHGLLMKVRDLGITLISVEVIDPPTVETAEEG